MNRRAFFAGIAALFIAPVAKAKGVWDSWRPVKPTIGSKVYWECTIDANPLIMSNFGESAFKSRPPLGFEAFGNTMEQGSDDVVGVSVDMSAGKTHYRINGPPAEPGYPVRVDYVESPSFQSGDVVAIAADPSGEYPPMIKINTGRTDFRCPRCNSLMMLRDIHMAPICGNRDNAAWLTCKNCSSWNEDHVARLPI